MNKNNLTYELRIKAIIDEAQKTLGDFEKQLKNTWEGGLPPKHMSRSLEGLRTQLTSLQEIAKKGVVDSSDLAMADGDYKAFMKTIHNLSIEFKLFTDEQKKAMLSPEEQRAMSARVAAIKEYNDELKRNQEILAKRQTIESEKQAAINKQKPARTSAEAAIEIYGNHKAALEKNGPSLSPQAKEYAATLKDQEKLLDEIRIKQAAIENLRKAGRREDRDNSLTKTIKELQELEAEYKKFNEMTGKSDYDKAMSQYAQELETATKAIEEAKKTISELDGELTGFDKQLGKLQTTDTTKALADLKKELKELGVEGIENAESIEEIEKAVEKLNGKALQRVDNNIAAARKELKQLGEQGKLAKTGIDEATQAIKKQEEAARQREALEGKIKQFLGLAGAAQVLRSALRNALSTITELDKTMTEMAVVTDLTVGDYWDQLPEYSKRASELGVSINSAYKAATLYYQQGLKTNEVNAISTETLKMARIAGLSAEDATNKMTAALRGFNMELNETSAQKISDVYSELAAITAADTKEIASAMTKTASIAASAGMEFETTAAFLSQIIETTRESAETAGTAMKTVIARFQELKKSPDEIGEIDGEIVDANKIETALRSVGVALRDASGQFRNLDEVFLELSSKWDTLDTNTQRYIATIAAGSRQQSRFIAMMSDYGRTQELVSAANNSAGASNKQFEKTMDSLESKVEELKNAWREFSMGILNSELVKAGVEILTKFLNIINKMTGALDGVWGSAMKLISVISLFKLGQKIFDKFKNPLIKMFADIVPIAHQGGINAGKAFSEGVKEAKKELEEGSKPEDKPIENKKEQKKQTVGSLTGVSDFWSGAKGVVGGFKVDKKAAAAEREKLQQNLARIEAERAARSPDLAKYDSGEIKTKEGKLYKKNSPQYRKALKQANGTEKQKAEYDEAKNALEDFDNKQKETQENAIKGWEQAGQGLQKMGATVAAVGIGVSAFGGILSSLGLEEVGEGFAKVGNVLTLVGAGISAVGTALTAIPPLLTLISTHPIILIITVALALILGLIIAIVAAIKKASPEEKLKQAQEAAENAAEAANAAAEAYDGLVESLEGLEDKYKALEDLTRGTKEWNEAVREINSSVIDLISEYPELAKFVKHQEGVLTIDVDSTEVQSVLKDAENRKLTSANYSMMANLATQEAQNEVAYKNLTNKGHVGTHVDPILAGWGAGLGSTTAGATAGAGIGALSASTLGTLAFPGLGTVGFGAAGAVVGSVIGGIVGTIAAPAAGVAAKKAAEENNEKVKADTDRLAQALAKGDVLSTEEEIQKELVEMGYASEKAKEMAKQLAENADSLRKYGESLNEVEEANASAYNAIATSAQSLANTLTMTEEQIRQSSVLVDGEVSEEFYNDKRKKLENEVSNNSEKDIKELSKDTDVKKAIEKEYGPGATMNKKGEVYDTKGEKVDTLTSDELIALISTQYATEQSAKAIEYSDDAILRVIETMGQQIDDSDAAKSAVNALYARSEGGALTQADLVSLQSGLIDYDTIWESLSPDEKIAYGNEKDNLINDFTDAVEKASTAFTDAGDAVRSFMTADMAKGFSEKLEQVANMVGGQAASEAIQKATDRLLGAQFDEEGNVVKDKNGQVVYSTEDGSLSNEKRISIQSRIDATDWTNLESLLSLQIDLEQQYGYTTEEAKAYVDTIAKQAYATSSLTTVVQAYGELWKANEKIAQSIKRVTELQWEYNRALGGQGGVIEQLTQELLEQYQLQAEEHVRGYGAANDNIARVYAQGGLNYNVDLRKVVTLGQKGIEVDQSELDKFIAAGKISQSEADEWLKQLNEQYENANEHYDGLRKTLDSVEELEKQQEEAYYELRDMAKETIVDHLQKQIDLQQQTLEATREANAALINKIQEQINDARQARAKEDAEKNIADLQSKAAYLAMDTSGANALESLNTNKQIEKAEQDYQDSLVDQTIQSLQDANAKAEEQRERQITLAEMSLEEYQKSAEFQSLVDEKLEEMLSSTDWENTELGSLMRDSLTEGMSGLETAKWMTDMVGKIGATESWKNTDWGSSTSNIESYLAAIAEKEGAKTEGLTGEAAEKKIKDQVSKLRSSGFEPLLGRKGISVDTNGEISGNGENGSISESDESFLNKLSSVLSKEETVEAQDELKTKITKKKALAEMHGLDGEANKFAPLDKATFYSKFNEKKEKFVLDDGTEYNSYTDYLTKMAAQEVKGVSNLTAQEAFGGGAVSGDSWKGAEWAPLAMNWESGANFNAKVNGEKDTKVHLGTIASEKQNNRLDYIWNKTGSSTKPFFYLSDTDQFFLRQGAGKWWDVRNTSNGEFPRGLRDAAKRELEAETIRYDKPDPKIYQFKTGGLADFTGPAWLDGTKSRPELVLNARDTQNFIVLKDILADILSDTDSKTKTSKSSGDNYFDIEINVEKIEDDYDVERMAEKIRSMIYADATYRNVNAINHIR